MKKTILSIFLCISLNAISQNIKFEKNNLNDTLIGNEKIWTTVNKAPEFPGGEIAWNKFLYENILFENISGAFDFESPIQGDKFTIIINISFVVRENGNVVNIKNVDTKGNNSSFAKEAIRVVSLTPKWSPAVQDGKYVNFLKEIPVKFVLKLR